MKPTICEAAHSKNITSTQRYYTNPVQILDQDLKNVWVQSRRRRRSLLLLLLLLLLLPLAFTTLLRVLASSFLRFRDHTQRHNTVGRTPLDE